MSPLPKAPSHGHATGMPQMRRKSAIRTASDSVQEQFLARVRAVAEDMALVLPECPDGEPAALARLRRQLESGRLPFTSRWDRGLLGALRISKDVAALEGVPRLLDARVDGNRRFYLVRGHVNKLCILGVQNWDDPLALMLAYGPLAMRAGLHFFAGRELWCTGASPHPPAAWLEDLAERAAIELAPDGRGGAACPHAEVPRVRLAFRGGPALLVCAACGHAAKNLHNHVSQRYLCDKPARPVEVTVALPGGGTAPVADAALAAYRSGKSDEAELLESTLKSWHKQARGAGRFVLAGRDFGADQDAFLDALPLADWEREPVRRMTAGGHAGAHEAIADVLADHRDALPQAIEAILPGQGEAFAREHGGVEARTLLRLAHETSERQALTRGLASLEGLGPLAQWIDGYVREARTAPRAQLLSSVRRRVSRHEHPAHLFAFLAAAGLEGEAERTMTQDQKDAGRHWAGLAKAVLDADGPAYREAVLTYLRETGAGETA